MIISTVKLKCNIFFLFLTGVRDGQGDVAVGARGDGESGE